MIQKYENCKRYRLEGDDDGGKRERPGGEGGNITDYIRLMNTREKNRQIFIYSSVTLILISTRYRKDIINWGKNCGLPPMVSHLPSMSEL